MINLADAAATGVGVYSIPEAARYARIHPATLRNWFAGGADRAPLRQSTIECAEMKVITFLDFVEAVAIRSLRIDGVSFPRIRQALKTARDEYGVTHPFAHQKHRTVLIGKDLHIFLGDDPENPVQLTGRNIGQKSMRPCIQEYIRDLDFDEKGIARLYRAFAFKGQDIVLNPRLHFGEPILQENGYTAETLYRAAVAEGSIQRAALLYKASENAVEAAYRYHHELALAA